MSKKKDSNLEISIDKPLTEGYVPPKPPPKIDPAAPKIIRITEQGKK